jgi:type IV pilus assembly protein PilM
MEFLPRTLGTRPRLACEVRPEGVVAARAEDASAVLEAVARVPLADGTVLPQLHPDDAAGDGTATVSLRGSAGRAAMVGALRTALEQVSQRGHDVTLVVPDATVRVLLLDFDELPAKAVEALPVVRFRLKKLLPFDADDAAVSYQVMASSRGIVQVLAVAMPREVLAEYESMVREAGFEPGAVLPSTLAALAGLDEGEMPRLVVNAGREGVTTAIVKGGVVLLHRTVDLSAVGSGVDVRGKAPAYEPPGEVAQDLPGENSIAAIAARLAAVGTPTPVLGKLSGSSVEASSSEVAQAVSVAAAYFEDTLETAPVVLLAAGTLGAEALTGLLDQAQVGPVAVEEIVNRHMLGYGASTAGSPGGVPLGWLAGVRGALAN